MASLKPFLRTWSDNYMKIMIVVKFIFMLLIKTFHSSAMLRQGHLIRLEFALPFKCLVPGGFALSDT